MKEYDQDNDRTDRLLAALKPVLGSCVDRLWLETRIGNDRQRARARRAVWILAAQQLGVRPGDEAIRLEPPPPSMLSGGPISVGEVLYPGLPPSEFSLWPSELLRHVLILGASGGGKTTLLLGILRQVRVSWAALDWKRNYRVLLHEPGTEDLVVLTVGSDIAPLRMNLLLPPRGVSQAEWNEAVCDAICASWLLMDGARKMVKDSINDAQAHHGNGAVLRDTLPFLVQRFVHARYREAGWLESAKRAIEELTTGPYGEALNARRDPMTMEELLERRVVFELEGLGMAQAKMFCITYLMSVKLTRKRQSLPKEVLHHLTLADEAHNVFTKERRGDPPTVQSTVARELRELGEGIVTSTQSTDISESIIANSKTTIVLETRFPYDVRLMGDVLGVKHEYLPRIPLGQGIIRLPERSKTSLLFRFPQQPIKNQPTSDDLVRERYERWRGTTRHIEPAASPVMLRERDVALLLDVAQTPISGITERYTRLGWNAQKGNDTKDRLIRDGLAAFETVEAGRTRVKILTLTETGKTKVVEHGGTIPPRGPGGLEHEFWRQRLRERCQDRGWTVTSEHALPNGKRVDLHAQRGKAVLLLEVETGKSDIHKNITQASPYGTLVVFCTSTTAQQRVLPLLRDGVLMVTPETLSVLHEQLA